MRTHRITGIVGVAAISALLLGGCSTVNHASAPTPGPKVQSMSAQCHQILPSAAKAISPFAQLDIRSPQSDTATATAKKIEAAAGTYETQVDALPSGKVKTAGVGFSTALQPVAALVSNLAYATPETLKTLGADATAMGSAERHLIAVCTPTS